MACVADALTAAPPAWEAAAFAALAVAPAWAFHAEPEARADLRFAAAP